MAFLFQSRSPGKRQVKPSADIALLEEQLHEDEDSDSDFDADKHVNGHDHDTNSDNKSSSDNDSDSDDDGSGDNDDKDDATLRTADLASLAASVSAGADEIARRLASRDSKICGCCLGTSSNDSNEIVECDNCGVTVHEGCYGISECESLASDASSASTEPWFCEPCRSRIDTAANPPDCVLCPMRGGLYKETDVGQWVHLVCALYLPGIAFADADRMTSVTLFEMNYANFGRKTCSLCQDQRMANTGVVLECDAGMCKSYFHATCAQAHGLLCEPKFLSDDAHHSDDLFLAHCRLHSDRSVVKARRERYLTMVKTNALRAEVNAKQNSSRTKRKLEESQKGFEMAKTKRPQPWIPTQKLARKISTSASAIRKFQRLAEIQGLSEVRYIQREEDLKSLLTCSKKWHLPPKFDVEFVAYFHDRQNRIGDLQRQLSSLIDRHAALQNENNSVTAKFDSLKERGKKEGERKAKREKLVKFNNTWQKLLPKGKELEPCVLKDKNTTPHLVPKTTVYARSVAASNNVNTTGVKKAPDNVLKSCALCHRYRDQHLLAHCDTCKLHYHLGCLTPPLTRMPKKSKLYGWQCSECDEDDDDEEEVELNDTDKDERRRRKRQTAEQSRFGRLKSPLVSKPATKKEEEEVEAPKPVTIKVEEVEDVFAFRDSPSPPPSTPSSLSSSSSSKRLLMSSEEALQRQHLIERAMSREEDDKERRRRKKEKKKRKKEDETEEGMKSVPIKLKIKTNRNNPTA